MASAVDAAVGHCSGRCIGNFPQLYIHEIDSRGKMDMSMMSKGQGHSSDIEVPISPRLPVTVSFPPLFTRSAAHEVRNRGLYYKTGFSFGAKSTNPHLVTVISQSDFDIMDEINVSSLIFLKDRVGVPSASK